MAASKGKYIIGLFILLMLSAIIILDISMVNEQTEADLKEDFHPESNPIPAEQGMFRRSVDEDYASMPSDKNHQRSLQEYYNNRAYTGAPPIIPHPVLEVKTIGGKNCLQCHQNGGFVDAFKAYAPITPHPELLNCKQCHVPRQSATLFKETEFLKLPPTELNNSALEGSPPIIPHAIQLRENCLTCHAGPAAPKEIRVTHPERTNCRQCHSLPNTSIQWKRQPTQVLLEE